MNKMRVGMLAIFVSAAGMQQGIAQPGKIAETPTLEARLQLGAAETIPMRVDPVSPAISLGSAPEPPPPQVKDTLFEGTEKFSQGASDVTDVNLDRSMLGMVGGKGGGNADLARKMNFVVVHSFTYDKPGMYRLEDVEAYRKKLVDGSWNCFIHTRDKSGSTDICSRTGADHETNELVILSAEPKELTFVHLQGKLSMSDLSKMGGKMGASAPDVQSKLK